jgi:hypothetical protein
MPPFVQSANWQTLARQAGRLLTKVKPPNINTIKTTLPRKVARAIRQSFPSLSTPAHLLELNPAYAFTSSTPNQLSRGFNKAVTLNRLHQPFTQASRGFRTAARRPTTPFASNVGLGTARSYSSGPQQAFHGNVPVALRALASLVDQDTDKSLPGSSRYKPYYMPKKLAKTGKRSARVSYSIDSVKMARRAERQIFFPRINAVDANLPENRLQPERLVTNGINTTLTIAIGQSFLDIFDTAPAEPFITGDLGVRVFANLLPPHLLANLVDNPVARHLMAFLQKLDSLGVTAITREGEFARVEMAEHYVEHEGTRMPEVVVLKFWDRSEMDVRKIAGESLRPREEGWILREERAIRVVSPAEAMAALAAWEDAERPNRPRPIDNSDLIMPRIDISDSLIDHQYPDSPVPLMAESVNWNVLDEDDLEDIEWTCGIMEPDSFHEEDFENEWSD